MIGTFQKALVKKGKTTASRMDQILPTSPAAESPNKKKANTLKNKKKKGPGEVKKQSSKTPTKGKKKKEDQSDDGSSDEEEEDGEEREKSRVQPAEGPRLLGQVENSKADPKQFTQRILKWERPELFAGHSEDVEPDEIRLLDEFLLKKGELKGGVSISLGKVVDMESKIEVGSGNEVEILMLYAHGRFGNVYLTYKEPTEEQERKNCETFYALKTSRRAYAAKRIQTEISILDHLWNPTRGSKGIPGHIAPLFFHGTVGGNPYFMMPILDVSLEKLRQEVGYKLPWSDVFFIASESIQGIKEAHTRHIVHRDIKPTNLLLGGQNSRNFWLCDFGDACKMGQKSILSPPDSLTLPFMSREAHRATRDLVAASFAWDLESWFYMVLDLFTSLPWKLETEEAETLAHKQRFWSQIDQYFQINGSILPPQLHPLAQLLMGPIDDHIYSKLTAILKDGFMKNCEGGGAGWKPSWVDKRKKMGGLVMPNMKGKKKKMKKAKGKKRK